MGLRGKNRLRKQRLDIALYDKDGNLKVIENHDLSESKETTEIPLPVDFEVAAVYVNHGNHAYAKVRFDQASIDWFTANLSKVKTAGTRASIWRYFWYLVMDLQMSSVQYLDFVEKNLPHESVEQITTVALMNLSQVISRYTPQMLIKDNQKRLFDILVLLL